MTSKTDRKKAKKVAQLQSEGKEVKDARLQEFLEKKEKKGKESAHAPDPFSGLLSSWQVPKPFCLSDPRRDRTAGHSTDAEYVDSVIVKELIGFYESVFCKANVTLRQATKMGEMIFTNVKTRTDHVYETLLPVVKKVPLWGMDAPSDSDSLAYWMYYSPYLKFRCMGEQGIEVARKAKKACEETFGLFIPQECVLDEVVRVLEPCGKPYNAYIKQEGRGIEHRIYTGWDGKTPHNITVLNAGNGYMAYHLSLRLARVSKSGKLIAVQDGKAGEFYPCVNAKPLEYCKSGLVGDSGILFWLPDIYGEHDANYMLACIKSSGTERFAVIRSVGDDKKRPPETDDQDAKLTYALMELGFIDNNNMNHYASRWMSWHTFDDGFFFQSWCKA